MNSFLWDRFDYLGSELQSERAKVSVRWLAIGILLLALLWVRSKDQSIAISNSFVVGITIAALTITGVEAYHFWRPGNRGIHPGLKYVTIFADMTFISILIFHTGFSRSPFFYVYFIFLISNCLRYGLLMSIYVAMLFNLMYALVLGLAPEGAVQPSTLGGEGIKILAFWAVALYGGSISARLRRQANQLRVYEETILSLKQQLGAPTVSSSDVEGTNP